jgi:uncharacterized protein (DUF427 family)
MTKQQWKFEPTGRWIRATRKGTTVVDSKRAMLMLESPGEADYYFPVEDVRGDLLQASEYIETSGYRGTRRYYHLLDGDQLIKNAAWTYDAKDGRPDFTGYVAFKWEVVEHWYEEEEEIFLHPRNPYHRVDTIPSSRHVEIYVDGVKVADTKRPYLLFETSLPTRYYIPVEDVDEAYLSTSELHTVCPYKGTASYYDLVVNGETYRNAVWTYPDPISEAPKIKGALAFWPEKDKRIAVVVDGETIR